MYAKNFRRDTKGSCYSLAASSTAVSKLAQLCKRLTRWLWVLAAVVWLAACGGSGEGLDQTGRPLGESPIVDQTPSADFSFLQNTVLTPVCTVCHAGGSAPVGLRLDAANSFAMLVSVASAQDPNVLRVAPGEPDNSYLIQKLEGTAAVGAQMPLGGPALDAPTIALFRQWILDGALPPDTSNPPATPPTVITVAPGNNAVLSASPNFITANFSQAMDASLVSNMTFRLRASGSDGTFTDGNEIEVTPVSVTLSSAQVITMDVTGLMIADDVYEAQLLGTGATALADLGGLILDGDSDGTAGGDFSWQFTLTTAAAPKPSWRWTQDNVYTPICTQCHVDGGIASFLLLDEANSFAMTVNVPGTGVPTLDLIEPGDANASYLIQKLEGTAATGAQMPLGQPPLAADVIAAIRAWIDAGALLEPGDPMPDTMAPVVTLNAPPSVLAGTVVLTAMASDDTGVTAVRFFSGGLLIGADTAAPYELNWDTLPVLNGAHLLRAEADDAAGNTGTSATVNVTVDNAPPIDDTPPVVAVNDPGSPLSGSVNLSVTASDDTGVTVVRLYINDTLEMTFTTEPYDFAWNTTTLVNGNYVLRAEAGDATGNVGSSTSVTVTVDNGLPPDNEIPIVTIDTPASPLSGVIDVTLTASDNIGVTIVRLYVDGSLAGSDTAPPYAITYDSTALTDGDHLLSAQAEDAAGNIGFSNTLVVTIINGGPQPTLEWIQANVFSGICTACHIDGGIAAFLLLDDANSLNMLVNVPSMQVTSLDRVEPGLPNQSYLVQKLEGTATIGAQMPLGGTPLPMETIAVIRQWISDGANAGLVDSLAPVVTFNSPSSPVFGILSLAVDAVDNIAVTQVRLRANGVVVATDLDAPYLLVWDTAAEADGTYTLVAEADDAAGNTGASIAIEVQVQNGVADNVPPIVTIDTPAQSLSGQVTFTVQASDNVGVVNVELAVDGVLIGTDAQAPYEFIWDSSTATDGTHSLTATASDAIGNVGTSSAMSILVDNSTPADTTLPLISIDPLIDPLAGTVTISTTASDDVSVTLVRVLVDGIVIGTDLISPFAVIWDTTSVADGVHALTAEAHDAAGNIGMAAAVNVTVTNAASVQASWRWIQDNIFTPKCVVCHIANGAADFLPLNEEDSYNQLVNAPSSEGGPPFRVLPGDSDNSSLVQRLEGTLSPQMPLGGAQLPAAEIDAVRQWILDGALAEVPADVTAPVILLVAPGAVVSATITLLADVTDDVGVTEVRFFVNGNLLGSDATAPFQAIWDTTLSGDGPHTLTAEALDAAGNVGGSTPLVVTVDNTLPPDVTPPTVSIVPVSDPVSGTVTISLLAEDFVGVTSVALLVDGTTIGTDFFTPFQIPWNTLNAGNGVHALVATATDAAGNTGTSETVSVTVFNTAPLINVELLSPPSVADGDDFTVTATISNAGSASDSLTAVLTFTPSDAVRIEEPGSSQVVGPVTAGDAVSATWLMRADEVGTAVITVTVTDTSGSVNEQGQISVTVTD